MMTLRSKIFKTHVYPIHWSFCLFVTDDGKNLLRNKWLIVSESVYTEDVRKLIGKDDVKREDILKKIGVEA